MAKFNMPPPGASTDDLLRFLIQIQLAQIPAGLLWGYNELVNAAVMPPLRISPALFSIVLVNDGPGQIQYLIPADAGNWVTINPTEVQSFSGGVASFDSINRRMVTLPSFWRLVGIY